MQSTFQVNGVNGGPTNIGALTSLGLNNMNKSNEIWGRATRKADRTGAYVSSNDTPGNSNHQRGLLDTAGTDGRNFATNKNGVSIMNT